MFTAPSAAWKTNWWVHTISFFALLVVIPESKHLHLVLSPFAIFFRPETTSGVRALREDGEDLGLVHFKELTWKDVSRRQRAASNADAARNFVPRIKLAGL